MHFCCVSLWLAHPANGVPPKVVVEHYCIGDLKAALTCCRTEEGAGGGSGPARLAAALRHLAVQTPKRHPHHRSAPPWVLPVASACGTGTTGGRQGESHFCRSTAASARICSGAAASVPSGGWYFEWVGYDAGRNAFGGEHPAWLPPTAMVLRAAFETLEVRGVTMVLLCPCAEEVHSACARCTSTYV